MESQRGLLDRWPERASQRGHVGTGEHLYSWGAHALRRGACLGVLWVPIVEQSGEGSGRTPEPRAKHGTCQRPRCAEAAPRRSPIRDGYFLLPAVLLAEGAEPGEEEDGSSPGRVHRDASSLSPPPGSAEPAPHTQPAEEERGGAGPADAWPLPWRWGMQPPCQARHL